jgi:hypothetical protein
VGVAGRKQGDLICSATQAARDPHLSSPFQGEEEQAALLGESYRCSNAIRLDVSQRLPPIFCTSE